MKNKGITLIALVITVIVLLILAGISISMLSGNNSILSRAGQAKDESVVGQEKEQVELAYVSVAVNKLGNDVTDGELQTELNKSVGDGKTDVSTNDDDTLNVYFIDTEHNYNVNNGNVTKVEMTDSSEDLKKLKQYFMGKGYSGFMEDIYDEDDNLVSRHCKNNEIIPDASTSIQFVEYGIKYHNRKYDIIGNGEGDDYVVTDIEDITNMTIVVGTNYNRIKFTPKTNETWYEWATDTEDTNDLDIFVYDTKVDSLKSLIINRYENDGETTDINKSHETNSGLVQISLTTEKHGGIVQQCNTTIVKGKVYYIYSIN